jgi:hypothetical protein
MLATVLVAALNLGASQSTSLGVVQLVPPLLLGDFGFQEEQKAPKPAEQRAQEPEPPSGLRGDIVDRQHRVVRPADAPPPIVIEAPTPPAPGVKEAEQRASARAPETLDEWHARDKWLQPQIDALRERRPSLAPPLLVFGLGTICALAGGVALSSTTNAAGLGAIFTAPAVAAADAAGVVLLAVSVPVGLIGLGWLIANVAIRADLDQQIKSLEGYQFASERPAVIPWTRGGASGLALAIPMR